MKFRRRNYEAPKLLGPFDAATASTVVELAKQEGVSVADLITRLVYAERSRHAASQSVEESGNLE